MFPVFSPSATASTDPQQMTARAVAAALPYVAKDPPAVDLPFGVLGGDELDPLFDATGGIDLDLVTLGYSIPTGMAEVTQGTRRNFPVPSLHRFLAFADWDNDPTAGGSPSLLGFDGCTNGVDLVTLVIVRTADNGTNVPIARAWRYTGGEFVELASGELNAEVLTETWLHMAPPPEPDRVQSVLPSAQLGLCHLPAWCRCRRLF